MTVFLGDGLQVFLFVESGIVKDQGGMGTSLFTQQVAQPRIDESRIGGAGEPQGGEKIRAAPRGNPVFTRALMAQAVAVNLVPPWTSAGVAIGHRLEAGFVDVHPIRRATLSQSLAQRAQVHYLLFRIALFILEGLFLRVIRMRFKALPTTLRSTPQNAACSRKVASGCWRTCARGRSRSSFRWRETPFCSGRQSFRARQSLTHHRLTPNRRAASAWPPPS